MNTTLRIKLYGESIKIHKIDISKDQLTNFNKAADELLEPLHTAILNLDFFNALNLQGIFSLEGIIDKTFFGLINNQKSQIEISFGRKKITKFKADELFRTTRLFPMFNTQTKNFNTANLSEGIYIIEKEIGLVGHYELRLDHFQVDLLQFFLTELEVQKNNYELLHHISYGNQFLTSVKSDTLLTSQGSFLVK